MTDSIFPSEEIPAWTSNELPWSWPGSLELQKLAFDKYRNYNLSHYKLTLFVNAEPCIMCLGAIMWSGVNKIIFSVPSSEVERITGFDEGFKPNWFEEMKKRNIKACGGIDEEYGKKILQYYVDLGKTIYKPAQ